jgi:hypothetical protein
MKKATPAHMTRSKVLQCRNGAKRKSQDRAALAPLIIPPQPSHPICVSKHQECKAPKTLETASLGVQTGTLLAHDQQNVSSTEESENLLRDEKLYAHFVSEVLCLSFPVLQAGSNGETLDTLLQFFFGAEASGHYCLATSAIHIALRTRTQESDIKQDALRHVDLAVYQLRALIHFGQSLLQSVNTIFVVLVLQTLVDIPSTWVTQLPWQLHFHAAIVLIQRPDREGQLLLVVTLTIWIDILGATMLGRRPLFGRLYQEYRSKDRGTGLLQLMGCNDGVMYLIAEIAELEALEAELSKEQSEKRFSDLSRELGGMDFTIAQRQGYEAASLAEAVTAAFQVAAKLYLLSLKPRSWDMAKAADMAKVAGLVNTFCVVMTCNVPGGANGFDRSIAWPLLMAGSMSQRDSSFRELYSQKRQLPHWSSNCGALGKVQALLEATWKINDDDRAPRTTWRAEANRQGWSPLIF